METGQFFGPTFSGADPNTNSTSGRADRLANGNLSPDQRSISHWFDTTAFARPAAGRFGNSGTNILEGPGLHKHDLTLSKTFPIKERLRFTFMAVAQNFANHPNFSNPASNINATNVGVVSSTRAYAPARQIMLRGRVSSRGSPSRGRVRLPAWTRFLACPAGGSQDWLPHSYFLTVN